jgi:hypothetical protein
MFKGAMHLAAGLGLLGAGVAMGQGGTTPRGRTLVMDHIHLGVRDLPSALAWFERVLQWTPTYRDDRIAVIAARPLTIILDKSDHDAAATLSFKSSNVDADFERLVGRGAVSLEAPNDKPYGVRGAYLHGPASLRIELEGPLKKAR